MKKKLLVLTLFSIISLSAGILAVTAFSEDGFSLLSSEEQQDDFQIVFSKNKNKLYSGEETGHSEEDAVVKTELNNDVHFSYSNLTSGDYWQRMEVGSSFTTTSKVKGCKSLTINAVSPASDLYLKVYWSDTTTFSDTDSKTYTVWNLNNKPIEIDFNSFYPSYFKVENLTDRWVTIYSMQLSYSCTEPVKYNVTAFSQNPTMGSVTTNITKTIPGTIVTVRATSNLGYAFIKWIDGGYNLSDDTTSLTYEFIMPNKHVYIMAEFDNAVKEISLDANGGNCSESSVTATNNAQYSLPIPTRTGYIFTGWMLVNSKSPSLNRYIPDEGTWFDDAFRDNVSLVAQWVDQNSYDSLKFTLSSDGDYYMVSAIDTSISGNITIPGRYNNLPVKSIASKGFSSCCNITGFTLPYGLELIGSSSLAGCSGITSIVIPSTVKSIGLKAFYGCSSLLSITIPDSVTELQGESFKECSSLQNAIIGNGITRIPDNMFKDCESLTTVSFGENVQTLGFQAFYGCSSLVNLALPSSLVTIEERIFTACTSLESVFIPKSVENIASQIMMAPNTTNFKYFVCEAESEPNSWDHTWNMYGQTVIWGAKGLGDYTATIGDFDVVGNENGYIITGYHGNSAYTTIDIPNKLKIPGTSNYRGVIGLGYKLFDGNTTIKTVYVSTYNKYVFGSAFNNCTSLERVSFREGEWGSANAVIEYRAFYGCTSLFSTNIYAFFEKIGMEAFRDCSTLADEILVDSTAQYLGSYAFYNCSSIERVIFNSKSLSSILDYTFYGCTSLSRVDYFDHSTIKNISNSAFSLCSSLSTITLPSCLELIDEYAFSGCSNLSTINNIENTSLTSINASAFRACSSLTSIIIPASVTWIGKNAFANCTSMTNIYLMGPEGCTSPFSSSWNKNCNAEISYNYVP